MTESNQRIKINVHENFNIKTISYQYLDLTLL